MDYHGPDPHYLALLQVRVTQELVKHHIPADIIAYILVRAFPDNYRTTLGLELEPGYTYYRYYRCCQCYKWIQWIDATDYRFRCQEHKAIYCKNCGEGSQCQMVRYSKAKNPINCSSPLICKRCTKVERNDKIFHRECFKLHTIPCYICKVGFKKRKKSYTCSVCKQTVCGKTICTRFCTSCYSHYCYSGKTEHGNDKDKCNNCI